MEKSKGKGKFKGFAINILVTLVFGLVYFYFELPAINLHDKEFYGFFFLVSAVYCVMSFITSGIYKVTEHGQFFANIKKTCFIPFILCVALLALLLLGSLASSVVFRAGSYTCLLYTSRCV